MPELATGHKAHGQLTIQHRRKKRNQRQAAIELEANDESERSIEPILDHPLLTVAGSARDQDAWDEYLQCIQEGRRKATKEALA